MLAVWAAHDWQAQPHLARLMAWLLVAWPADKTAPTKYWLAPLGPQPWGLRRLVRTAQARWRVAQDYRALTEELGAVPLRRPPVVGLAASRLPGDHRLCLIDAF